MAVDDWLVADSEDEDAFELFPSDRVSTETHSIAAVSAIQTATFTPDQPRTTPRRRKSPSELADQSLFTPPGIDSTIDNFTSVPSTSAGPSTTPPKPRPRPRVVMKKAAPSDPNVDATSTFSLISDPPTSATRPRPRVVMKKAPGPNIDATSTFSHISDPPIPATRRTNDSIHPATASSVGFSDPVDDVYSSLDIAERAKMRSRKSRAVKVPIHPQPRMNEVIELTSDEDELTLKPKKRQKKQGGPVPPKPNAPTVPRPKPRLKIKPAPMLPSGSPMSQTVGEDLPAPLAQSGPSSQPPASTLPSIPPSTPPQGREPTPLFSPLVATWKRKRTRPEMDEDDDEMDIISPNPPEGSPSFTMPPPFFAPSSSSLPTDSGIDIPPVESLGGRLGGKKKEVPSRKKGIQRKAPIKGKKGKKKEVASTVDETVGDSARLSQGPSTPAMPQSPSFVNEHHSPVVKDSTASRNPATKKASGKQAATRKGKARAIDSGEDEDELLIPSKSNTVHTSPADEGDGQRSKENLKPDDLSPAKQGPPPKHTSTPGAQLRHPSANPKMTPMSELIRRVNSQPNSPFPNASRTYSPFLKSSRTMLSRIAPLHANRRTPPPPLPRPPPPKKSKKQIELEERIEDELAETVEGWSCLTGDERKALRKARIDAELGYEE